nr:hypothetical protein GCM10020093_019920 [Planobispora longispora]
MCRRAGIKLAMITGDHPGTARAVAVEVGLLGPDALVLTGARLPPGDEELGELLDRDGVVVARVTPEDKPRIARAMRGRGHVVAMTGDGVNDGPALREADIGIAMGASGTDVAREAADLVLLDDHFATIVTAIELGRATYANIRRFLTYHLTDSVAELTPFAVWALSGGTIPLALSVLQVLALDIGTDLLPALALGAGQTRAPWTGPPAPATWWTGGCCAACSACSVPRRRWPRWRHSPVCCCWAAGRSAPVRGPRCWPPPPERPSPPWCWASSPTPSPAAASPAGSGG